MLRYVDWTKMLAIMAQDWSKERAIAKLELPIQKQRKWYECYLKSVVFTIVRED